MLRDGSRRDWSCAHFVDHGQRPGPVAGAAIRGTSACFRLVVNVPATRPGRVAWAGPGAFCPVIECNLRFAPTRLWRRGRAADCLLREAGRPGRGLMLPGEVCRDVGRVGPSGGRSCRSRPSLRPGPQGRLRCTALAHQSPRAVANLTVNRPRRGYDAAGTGSKSGAGFCQATPSTAATPTLRPQR